jgi:glycerol-3-phosphate dehydrogenase subunit B
MISIQPEHPYSHLGIGKIEKAIDAFRQFCDQSGYPMLGSIDSNWLLPSSLGVARPTCLAPSTMVAGDMRSKESALIIGFNQFLDFYPELVADNLLAQGLPATSLIIDLPMLRGRNFVTGRTLAELFDTPEFLEDTILTIKNSLNGNPRNVSRIGFPAVLGLRNALFNHQLLEKELGLKVFEIPTLPPSIPGIRLHQLLIQAIERLGGRVLDGIEVTQSIASNGNGEPSSQLLGMVSDAAGRPKVHRAAQFILATGGILGGGIQSNFDTRIIEVVCNLQVRSPGEPEEQFSADFLSASGQKIYRSGVSVDKQFQPIDHQDRPVYKNLRAVGALLAGGDYIRERSLDGVSLATGYWVGNAI